jgi:hypothetical protein
MIAIQAITGSQFLMKSPNFGTVLWKNNSPGKATAFHIANANKVWHTPAQCELL